MLKNNPSRDLAVYVVWVPELDAQPKHVPEAARLVPDERAHHYWDGAEVLGKEYKDVLRIGKVAWDVYFLFSPGMRWGSAGAPRPDFWMHQMSKVREGPELNPKVFAAEVGKRTGVR